jgi:beta-glucosidase
LRRSQQASRNAPRQKAVAPRFTCHSSALHSANHSARSGPGTINDALAEADAFVAAWLPGTEGQGVTDVLFGDYKPTGKLSVTWPRAMTQLPINVGDASYDPLFRYGFGLSF